MNTTEKITQTNEKDMKTQTSTSEELRGNVGEILKQHWDFDTVHESEEAGKYVRANSPVYIQKENGKYIVAVGRMKLGEYNDPEEAAMDAVRRDQNRLVEIIECCIKTFVKQEAIQQDGLNT